MAPEAVVLLSIEAIKPDGRGHSVLILSGCHLYLVAVHLYLFYCLKADDTKCLSCVTTASGCSLHLVAMKSAWFFIA